MSTGNNTLSIAFLPVRASCPRPSVPHLSRKDQSRDKGGSLASFERWDPPECSACPGHRYFACDSLSFIHPGPVKQKGRWMTGTKPHHSFPVTPHALPRLPLPRIIWERLYTPVLAVIRGAPIPLYQHTTAETYISFFPPVLSGRVGLLLSCGRSHLPRQNCGKPLAAAIQTLLRGKTMLIQAILAALWSAPGPESLSTSSKSQPRNQQGKTTEAFLKEAEALLSPLDDSEALRQFAAALEDQFRERMRHNPECMLPSYNSTLPTGFECGQYLCLDVGGSTLRVALVELKGRKHGSDDQASSRIVRMRSFQVGPEVKALEGLAFFDWLAARMAETVKEGSRAQDGSLDTSTTSTPLLVGLAWSFPLEQTSLKEAFLQPMGKGFLACNGLIGRDLGHIIGSTCRKAGLEVELRAIINDGPAALLSQAFLEPSATRFGLIMGTGVNMAVHIPCSYIGKAKFGNRSKEWSDSATHVVVNTELGMFGHGILPMTRWDEELRAGHPRPDFQPLEHFVSGMYLGEVARTAILEAVETTGLLGGVVPRGLEKAYGLDTETLSLIEGDASATLESAAARFNETHPSSVPATTADMSAIRTIANLVSRRSAAIVAASAYALWDLRREAEATLKLSIAEPQNSAPGSNLPSPSSSSPILSPRKGSCDRAVVAYNGSVIERYPLYLETCQGYLDSLVEGEGFASTGSGDLSSEGKGLIQLVEAKESSLLGAAVALACA